MRKPQLICLGLSHQTASVELREQAVCTVDDLCALQDAADLRKKHAHIQEFVLLSTCNRFELYAVVNPNVDDSGVGDSDVADPRTALLEFATAAAMIDPVLIDEHLYMLSGMEAAEHLARVAAGVESLVLGESQILGQVSRAYSIAVAKHTLGPVLDATFRMAIRVGKRVHGETSISSGSVSISSVAVGTAERALGPLALRQALVIGLGEMGVQTLKALHGRGVRDIVVANRTQARAHRLAEKYGLNVCALDDMSQALRSADVVVSATGAPDFIIDRAMAEAAQRERGNRPLLLIDIALPRDIDPAVAEVAGIDFYDIDHLNQGVDAALALRQSEIPKAEAIIAEERIEYETEMRRLAVEPVVADFRLRAEAVRQEELERTLRYIGDDLDESTLDHIRHLTHALVNKLLHEPTVRLKEKATEGQAEEYVPAFQEMFGLPTSNGHSATNGYSSPTADNLQTLNGSEKSGSSSL